MSGKYQKTKSVLLWTCTCSIGPLVAFGLLALTIYTGQLLFYLWNERTFLASILIMTVVSAAIFLFSAIAYIVLDIIERKK